jgi:hypothetical protein
MHIPTNGHGDGEASLRCKLEFHGVCCCFEPTTLKKLDQNNSMASLDWMRVQQLEQTTSIEKLSHDYITCNTIVCFLLVVVVTTT